MDLWDEDRQEWSLPPEPPRPPRPGRARRALIVAVGALLLAGAPLGGFLLWAQDDEDSGRAGGSRAAPSASSACEAVDGAAASGWNLGEGIEQDVKDAEIALFSGCRWRMPESGPDPSALLVLYYGRNLPLQPSPTPTPVDGVPSARASDGGSSCLITWRTGFGQAVVQAVPSSSEPGRGACELAVDFAAAVAPNVPD